MRLIFLCLILLSGCFSMEDSLKGSNNKEQILNSWSTSIAKDNQNVQNVSADQLKEFFIKSDKPLFVLDHRSSEEQKVSLIKGAEPSTKVDLSQLPRNARVVVYCTIGARSSQYINEYLTKENSPLEIYNLSGGILAWTFAKGELETLDKKTTKKVHVFGPAYNVLEEGYEGVTE